LKVLMKFTGYIFRNTDLIWKSRSQN
jgi:hypothetical protein